MTELHATPARGLTEKFDAYQHAISETFVPLRAELTASSPFGAAMTNQSLGAVSISDISATSHTVARTTRDIRAGDPEFYKLGFQVRGYSVLTQDGREAALTPGDFALYDTSRPYSLAFDDTYRMMVVMFPRTLLRLPERPTATLMARRISGRQGTGAYLSPFLLQLGKEMTATDPTVNVHVGDAVLDLLAATLAEQLQLDSELSPHSQQRALVLRIRSFVTARLGDPDLTPTGIAQAHHISTRYLHRLFEQEGESIAEWIRRLRVEGTQRDLLDPRCIDMPVSAIGARWGLPSPGHFSRLFKSAVGISPGHYRTMGGQIRHQGDLIVPSPETL